MDSVLGCRSGHSTEVRLVVSPGPTEWGIHWGKRIRGKTWGKTWVIPTRSKPQRRLRPSRFESDSVGGLSRCCVELFCELGHCISCPGMQVGESIFIAQVDAYALIFHAYASMYPPGEGAAGYPLRPS